MVQDLVHKAIVKHRKKVDEWFIQKSSGLAFPFYSSFDIRDSSFKVAPVDANLFPAGFNNICQVDKESAVEIVRTYFEAHYPSIKTIALVSEEHTNNPYYWDNILTLRTLISEAGYDPHVTFARPLAEAIKVQSASGAWIEILPSQRVGEGLQLQGKKVDLIIANNDFSLEYPEFIENLKTPINPPYQMGWHARKKDKFFAQYNEIAGEFARLIEVDPWTLSVPTEAFTNFDINDDQSRDRLADQVDRFIQNIKTQYQERGIQSEAFAFVKNSAGTYGLGVTRVRSGEDVRQWNYKERKKMKAAKGGRSIAEVIIQEGIPTSMTSDAATAEPAIYMIGCRLAGGFLRTHGSKGPEENLNSPGAVYKRLCVSDLRIDVEGCPMENVYGWISRLSFLALSQEVKASGVEFVSYQAGCPYLSSSL